MIRSLIIWGLVAGLIAGLAAFVTASFAGEPALEAAIAYETAQAAVTDAGGGPAHTHGQAATVSRSTQSTAGLLTGTTVYGAGVGGLLALVFALVYGRIAKASPRITALWLGLGGFVTVYLVPFIKYPATPPGVGSGDTIADRTLLYFGMLVIALLAAFVGVRARAWVLARRPDLATLAGVGTFAVIVLAAATSLPGVNEIPADFPATTLWNFRFGNLATQATLWAALTVSFAYAAQRVMAGDAHVAHRAANPSRSPA